MLLVFDLDGTLYKAKPVVLHAARALAAEVRSVLTDGELLKYASKGASELLRALIPECTDYNAARHRYDTLLENAIAHEGGLYPGVRAVLEALTRDGHELTVCSRSGGWYIERVLTKTGINGLIGAYRSAEPYASKAEAIADMTATGVPAAIIGDTHGDIEAARALGLPAIAVTYGYGNKALLTDADFFADTPGDIAKCVRELVAQSKEE